MSSANSTHHHQQKSRHAHSASSRYSNSPSAPTPIHHATGGHSHSTKETINAKLNINPPSLLHKKPAPPASMPTRASSRIHNAHENTITRHSHSETKHPHEKFKPVTRCEHLERFKRAGGLHSFSKVLSTFVFPTNDRTRRIKARLARCVTCRNVAGTHVCLGCVYFGCIKKSHFRNHYKETGHHLACNVSNGSIYCFKCCDVFFDPDFDKVNTNGYTGSEWNSPIPLSTTLTSMPKYHDFYKNIFSKPTITSAKSVVGLRGLINLGHTCFMSCIVQSLIHTPLLRDFFLSSRITCEEKHDANRQKPCIVSLVANLYQEFYNGARTPVSLHGLLFRIWGNAAHLAGYEQQDAHEFFIAMLDALHLHFNSPDETGMCNCVIDVVFLGRLQSSVTCQVCGHKSITVDPFWDTSLHLTTEDPSVTLTLKDCLTRYTGVEHLGSTGMIWCNLCKNNQESTKQLKFKTLPMVLCLHLKRFEHRTSYKKIDTRVEFPEHLNMYEYTADYCEHEKLSSDKRALLENKKADSRYMLYAVVNHVGSLDGGHYYAFIRHSKNSWYKCDDHYITRASEEEVLSSPGYLLFYHKEVLYYNEFSRGLPLATPVINPNCPKHSRHDTRRLAH